MTALDASETDYPPRSARETTSEIAGLSIALVIIGVLVLVAAALWGAPVIDWMEDAGKVLYDQLGWTLGLYVAVLVGFYAVSIGGQVLGDGIELARVRRRLGAMAELMAAVTLPVVLIVGVYCWRNPAAWAVLFVLLPIVGIVFFLAVQLGAFVISDQETRIAVAERTRSWAQGRLKKLRRRSRRSIWLVVPLNAVAVAIIAVLVSLPAVSIEGALFLAALHGAMALLLLAVNTWSLYSFKTSADRLGALVLALPALLYFVVLGSALTIALGAHSQSPASWGLFTTAGITLLTTFWPRSWSRRFMLDWTVQGSATTLAARTLVKKYAAATREYLALTVRPPEPSSPLRRVRDGIVRALWPRGGHPGINRNPSAIDRASRGRSERPRDAGTTARGTVSR